MLGKLAKYDLVWIHKSISVFFIITLIMSTLTRVTSYFDTSFIGGVLYSLFKGATIGCLITLIVNCVIRIWVRFRLNFYKDESYLTHTLPVTKNTLYNSKMVSAIITLIISIIVVIISIAVAYLDTDMINKIKDIFNNNSVAFIFINLIIAFVLELLYMTLCGILGIIIGHKSNNGKLATSVVIAIILYFASQTLIFAITFGLSLLKPST